MKRDIVVDARCLAEPPGGFRRYLENLLPAMAAADADASYTLLTHQTLESQWNLHPFNTVVVDGSLSLPRRLIWERAVSGRLPAKVDAFYSPIGLVPRIEAPIIITVHDVAFHTHPRSLARHHRWYWRRLAKTWPSADLVLVPSQSTRDAVVGFGIEPTAVVVTGLGVAVSLVSPLPSPIVVPRGLSRIESLFEDDFVLFVGTIVPRKNVAVLLAAFERVRQSTSVRLVLAGARGRGRLPPSLTAIQPSRSALDGASTIVELGPVTDEELAFLYARATLLAMPSLDEGFGLPALEALSSGLPVVASNAGALPEVVGEAGVLLAPNDVDAWADAITRLLEDPTGRARLARKGLVQAQRFSWEKAGRTAADAMRALMPTTPT